MKYRLLRFYEQLPAYLSLLRRGQLPKMLRERRSYLAEQRALMADFQRRCPRFEVVEDIVNRAFAESSPKYQLAQFLYASNALARLKPEEVHDIGSHRAWVIGLAGALPVHTLDVRRPELCAENEVFDEGVAERLPWASDSLECVTSLCALEHFGLGSYGDPYDPEADLKAVAEIERVLRPGGHLVMTTLCTGRDRSFVRFNAGRVYSQAHLHEMFAAMELVDETFFSMPEQRFVGADRLQTTLAPQAWDIYFATWRKPS